MPEKKTKKKLKNPVDDVINLIPTDKYTEKEERDMQAEEVFLEALSIKARRKLAQRMIRMARKMAVARKVARGRFAPSANLKRRAQKLARSIFRKRVAGKRGERYAELGMSDKIAIDRMVSKQAPRIAKLVKRLLPAIRRSEAMRLQKVKGGSKDSKSDERHKKKFTGRLHSSYTVSGNPLFEATTEEKFNHLLKIGLADRSELSKYKLAFKDKNANVKFEHYREKILEVFDKIIDIVTGNSAIYEKTKQEVQRKHGTHKVEESKLVKVLEQKAIDSNIDLDIIEEVFNRGLSNYEPELDLTEEQFAMNRVNSFISGGLSYTLLDDDLSEMARVRKPAKRYNTKLASNRSLAKVASGNSPYAKEARRELLARKKAQAKQNPPRRKAAKKIATLAIEKKVGTRTLTRMVTNAPRGAVKTELNKVLKNKKAEQKEFNKVISDTKKSYHALASQMSDPKAKAAVKSYVSAKLAQEKAKAQAKHETEKAKLQAAHEAGKKEVLDTIPKRVRPPRPANIQKKKESLLQKLSKGISKIIDPHGIRALKNKQKVKHKIERVKAKLKTKDVLHKKKLEDRSSMDIIAGAYGDRRSLAAKLLGIHPGKR